jgi:hypothetical protein
MAAPWNVALTAMRHLAVFLNEYCVLPPRNKRHFGPLPEEIVYNPRFLKRTKTFKIYESKSENKIPYFIATK